MVDVKFPRLTCTTQRDLGRMAVLFLRPDGWAALARQSAGSTWMFCVCLICLHTSHKHTNTQLRSHTAARTQAQRVPANENAEGGSSSNPNLKCSVVAQKELPAALVGPSEQQQSDAEISASNMEKLQPLDPIESVSAELNHRLTSPHCQEHGWSDRLQRRQRGCPM